MKGGMAERSAIGRAREVRPEVRVIEAIVASAFGLSVESLHGDSRGAAAVAFARQVAMYLAHTRLGMPFTAIGAVFDRDRTTAAHGCRQVEERRENPEVDSILDYLERAVDRCSALTRGVPQ